VKGLHIIADFYNCPASPLLTSAKRLRVICVDACEAAGLTVLGDNFYQFDGFCEKQLGGVTGAVVLAESHLAIHTWPERAGATLDVYVCNVSADNSARRSTLSRAGRPPATGRHHDRARVARTRFAHSRMSSPLC
jgi:S-adenosylmethionine decarboxylase